MECLLKQAKLQLYDPVVVRHLLHTLSLFPLHSLVTLSDGGIAQVLRRDGENYAQPIVKRLSDGAGRPADDRDGPLIFKLAESELQVVQAVPTPGRGEIAVDDRILSLADR